MINLGQGKRPVSSVLVFGMLIRSRPTIPWETSPDPHKKFYGVHFLASFFSAISPVLSGFLSLLFSVQQPKGTCSCDWVTSGVQMRRGRRKRKKKEGEGGLALPLEQQLYQMKNASSPPSELWLLQFFTLAVFLPLPPPQNCLGFGVNKNGEKGEGRQGKGDSLNSQFQEFLSATQVERKGFSWVPLCLLHNAYFCILTTWDQAGDTWGKKILELPSSLVVRPILLLSQCVYYCRWKWGA